MTDAFLDSGAPYDFISLHLHNKIQGVQSTRLDKDDDTEVSSADGQPIKIVGTTKFKFHWHDHEGKRQTKRMKFGVIKDLYPPMIFGLQTYTDLKLPKAADTWPTEDSKRGLFIFNIPWKNKKQLALDALALRNIERDNAAAARREIAEQARERNGARHSNGSNGLSSRSGESNGSSSGIGSRRARS